jgi:hypothetical protein
MGDIHSKSIYMLEGSWPIIILVLAILFGGFATIIAAFVQKDKHLRSNGVVLGLI